MPILPLSFFSVFSLSVSNLLFSCAVHLCNTPTTRVSRLALAPRFPSIHSPSTAPATPAISPFVRVFFGSKTDRVTVCRRVHRQQLHQSVSHAALRYVSLCFDRILILCLFRGGRLVHAVVFGRTHGLDGELNLHAVMSLLLLFIVFVLGRTALAPARLAAGNKDARTASERTAAVSACLVSTVCFHRFVPNNVLIWCCPGVSNCQSCNGNAPLTCTNCLSGYVLQQDGTCSGNLS